MSLEKEDRTWEPSLLAFVNSLGLSGFIHGEQQARIPGLFGAIEEHVGN